METTQETTQDFIQTNQKRFIDELIELLKIPSISADSKYNKDVARAAEYIKTQLEKAGATNVEICPTDRKSTRLNSSHVVTSRMPSSA